MTSLFMDSADPWLSMLDPNPLNSLDFVDSDDSLSRSTFSMPTDEFEGQETIFSVAVPPPMSTLGASDEGIDTTEEDEDITLEKAPQETPTPRVTRSKRGRNNRSPDTPLDTAADVPADVPSGTPSSPATSSVSSGDEDEEDETSILLPKRRGRRRAAEIIESRIDPKLLNGPAPDCAPEVRRVSLTRERLLTIASSEMEARCDRLQADMDLTAAEQKELRRQRRLVKNREYAQQSRNKKKKVLAKVDTKIDTLRKENEALRQRLAGVEQEKNDLRSRIDSVVRTLGNQGSGILSMLLGESTEMADKKRRRVDPTLSSESSGESGSDAPVQSATTGIMLMVMLLSFGVSLNFLSPTRVSVPVPLASQVRAAVGKTAVRTPMGRALLQCDDLAMFEEVPDENATQHIDFKAAFLSKLDMDDNYALPPLVSE